MSERNECCDAGKLMSGAEVVGSVAKLQVITTSGMRQTPNKKAKE